MQYVSKERICALSDGVVAVAVTILVLELKAPEASFDFEILLHWARIFVAWLISFAMIALFWFDNHLLLAHAEKCSTKLTGITFAQLAAISTIPFASNLVIDHRDSVAAMLGFNIILFVNGMLTSAMSITVARDKQILLEEKDSQYLLRRARNQIFIYSVITVLSVAGGLLRHPFAGIVLWAASPIILGHIVNKGKNLNSE